MKTKKQPIDCLIHNGIKYAPSPRAMVETLFDRTGTASGFYKTRNGITTLYNPQGQAIATITAQAAAETTDKTPPTKPKD